MTRIEREKHVVKLMITLYCRKFHKTGGTGLCADCRNLLDYACRRLDLCPKGDSKSSCRKCDIHCYSPARRENIRAVMRYAGSRMIFVNPAAALRHLISALKG